MITIQVQTTTTRMTMQVSSPFDYEIELRPCLYCGAELVQLPDKFCRAAHRVAYCQKGLKSIDVTPPVRVAPRRFA